MASRIQGFQTVAIERYVRHGRQGAAAILVAWLAMVGLARAETAGAPGPEDTVRWFLGKARGGELPQAYQATSAGFRESTDLEQLGQFLRAQSLERTEQSSWVVHERSDDQVHLVGAALLTDGRVVPLRCLLVWDGRVWRIDVLATNFPERPRGLPPLDRQAGWVTDTLRVFGQSVREDDFTALHRHLARSARAETTPGALAREFGGFREREIDILPAVEGLPMVLTGSVMRNERDLEVAGHYDSRPLRVNFLIRYVVDEDAWRPVALQVQAAPPPGESP